MASEPYSGSKSLAIADGEWSCVNNAALATSWATADGAYQFWLELTNLAAGDEVRIRHYERARSGDSTIKIWEATRIGVQPWPMFTAPSGILLHGWDFTIQMIAGSTRTFKWSIRQA